MERRSDDLFRIHDLSVLRSPMPVHLLNPSNKNSSNKSLVSRTPLSTSLLNGISTAAAICTPARPTPKTPTTCSLSALFVIPSNNNNGSTRTRKSIGGEQANEARNCAKLVESSEHGAIQKIDVPGDVNVSACDENFATLVNKDNVQSTPLLLAKTLSASIDVSAPEGTRKTLSTDETTLPELNHAINVSVQNTSSGVKAVADENVANSIRDVSPTEPVESKKPSTMENQPPIRPGGIIELSRWSLVIVPNNASITKFERAVTAEWIVLVGKRPDMTEMWHSSLITGRISDREITTGSGRIYRLNGQLDESAMIEAGFSFDLVESFKDGIPKNWKERLLQEFSAIRDENCEHSVQGSFIPPVAAGSKADNTEPLETAVLATVSAKKRRRSLSGIKAPKSPRTLTISSAQRTSRDLDTDPPYEASPTKKQQRRRSDPPPSTTTKNSRWRDNLSPVVTTDASILGTTKSGRRVFKPLPYWENKYLGKDLSSPTANALSSKRTAESKLKY